MKLIFPFRNSTSIIKILKNTSIETTFEEEIFRKEKKYAIITDSNIAKIYKKELSKLPSKFSLHVIPAGEKSKKITTIEKLASELLQVGIKKSDILVALGGGVVGDITGLLASLYMRGIQYIQVPTTLLAMTDSAIGGKTGVNLNEGKNLLGTIYQPITTLIQPAFLKTLPDAEMQNGMAEVVKYGIIMSQKLFKFIEQNYDSILNKNHDSLNTIIAQCIRLKASVTSKDPYEKEYRKILNYGHTLGHAIEKATNYTLSHGSAISMGMNLENRIGLNKKIVQKSTTDRIQKLLRKNQPSIKISGKQKDRILEALMHDKKREKDVVIMYLPSSIGKSKLYSITIDEIKNVLL